ncbi:ferritin-3, chloroplastic [Ziziphus jujuba]|uniref:Ferritin n=1 Tax=Ziziphus jujuba TaxID=326968 RepID=A0A6P4AQ15_ZIZJJ|nr:ferritin-3, chloroplastic [Ziziphus jujuba]
MPIFVSQASSTAYLVSSISSLLCFPIEIFVRSKMFVKPNSSFSFSTMQRDGFGLPFFGLTSQQGIRSTKFLASVSKEPETLSLESVIFRPFEELKKDDLVVPVNPHLSLARQFYSEECEAAVNEQINVEYNASYVYHALFAYFDRDNIALKGLAKFFEESSEEEREHAEKLIKYQNIRGGKVKLHPLVCPQSEFEHAEKGDALFAMELALSLEKLTNKKLLNLHRVAERNSDPQLAEFIEREFLTEQVEAIKKIAEYVSQLRLVGKGHGVWHFDQKLLHEYDAA